jgi:hypothetical protein
VRGNECVNKARVGLNMDKQERLKLAVQLIAGCVNKEMFVSPNRHPELIEILKAAYNIIVEIDRTIPEKGPASLG